MNSILWLSWSALCFCSIEKILFGTLETEHEFYRKASFLARLGSGSASRSVYGGFALWGETALLADSSDLTAIPVQNVHPDFSEMRDTILVVSSVPKSISSSSGHKLMNDHPYAESRYNQALSNLSGMLSVLKNGDIENFIRITENEALSLHAMMMTSRENYLLFLPNTLEIIRKIRYFRETQKIPVCFTLDAGANVHMLYPGKYSGETTAYIQNELITYCENNRFIHDGEGTGPEYLNE